MQSSEVNQIGIHGLLHNSSVPHNNSNFQGIHDVCAQTRCNLKFFDVSDKLSDQEKQLVVQNRPNPLRQRVYATKIPDGILLHSDNGDFFSVLHAKSMYLPKGSSIPPYEILSQVAIPGQGYPQPIRISLDDEVCGPNTITRISPFAHVKQKLECLRPLESKSRVIFSSNGLGKFSGAVLRGDEADLIKSAFLGLNQHFQSNSETGEGIFDRKLKLVPEISQHLMLKNPDGDILLKQCADGIVGVRNRKSDKGNTFIFVVKTDDMHRKAPSQNGLVQIFKMDYDKKKNGIAKNRISFLDHPDDIHFLAPEFQARGAVHSHMTVQDILNQVGHSFNRNDLSNIGCEHFGHYLKLLDEYESKCCPDSYGE